jgi:predicted nucleic acid-binding protein
VRWLRSVAPDAIHLSALTLGEIMRGVVLRRKSQPELSARLEVWLRRLQRDHEERILPVTGAIAVEWGRISAIRPRGDVDGLIAATAIVHGLVVVTRNVADFDDTGVSLINPWDA